MDQSKVPQKDSIAATLKKKRSRRTKPVGRSKHDHSSMSSTPVSDDLSKASSDENGNSSGKMFDLNHCVSRSLPAVESVPVSSASDGAGTGSRLKRVKLKVGGVTRTIQTKSSFYGSNSESAMKSDHQPSDKKRGLQGIPWKDFSASFGIRRESSGKTALKNAAGDNSDPIRKSKRVRKRRADDDFDEDDADDEIRYLEKLKSSRVSGLEAQSRKGEAVEESGKLVGDAKKSSSGDNDYEEEEEEEEAPVSDIEQDARKKKKQKKDLSELQAENNTKTLALTTRQRALLSKDVSPASGPSQIEFPNGLPLAPSRKQKEKLSEVEQQLKKAEAAQRRRLLNEKAARETEEEAIRKILGQDSSRKKREEKMKKRQVELAQEKVANALAHASSTIRTVMGPNGTTVSFPQEMGFPKIFDLTTVRYPPPREMCAAPSCNNVYKYRDSKLRLPLCSLQCYKAIHESMEAEKAC